MNIYHYNRETGVFLCETAARKNPLEEGEYLIPAYATDQEPPAADDGEVAVFSGEGWSLVEDNRGVNYWIDGVKFTQGIVGPLPEGATTDEPVIVLTQKELDSEAKIAGVEFGGVMCSAAASDMWGLSAVRSRIDAGGTVNFEFANGSILELTPSNIEAFESVWWLFRESFFGA